MLPWLDLVWIILSLIGAVYTRHNLVIGWDAWQALRRAGAGEANVITAWTHVRTDGILMWMHLSFCAVGAIGLTRPGQPLPQDWQGWVTTVVVLSIPAILIVLSYTRSEDRRRVMGLLASGT